LVLILKPSGT